MEKNTKGKRDKALAFLAQNETGVLATVSPEGNPHARLLYYTSDEAFNIYFITLANTRKVADIQANAHVAFTASTVDVPQSLQLEGTVTDLTDTATNDPLTVAFIQKLMLKKPYGMPLERLDAAVIRIFKITPDWVRFGDFSYGEGTDAVLTEIAPTA
jgi:uncharacterized pyridoxamine 5'-phosphate oxidase family protein